MRGDIDWGQVIFLVLVVVVGFVRWVAGLLEQQKAAKERAKLSPEEQAQRDAAWRRQVGKGGDVEDEDPFGELKELFEQLKESERPAPSKTSAPPPLPSATPRLPTPPPIVVRHVATTPPPSQRPSTAHAPFVPTPTKHFPGSTSVKRTFTEAVGHRERPTAANLSGLRRQLRNPAALRQAILIREILGPPKALQEQPFSASS